MIEDLEKDSLSAQDSSAEIDADSPQEELTVEETPRDDGETQVASPLPDLAVGDMETDLPAATVEVDTLTPDAEDTEDMEIPWGDVDLAVGDEVDTERVAEAEGAAEATTEASTAEAEAQAAPAVKEATRRAWYVVHCYSGYENKVKKGLEQRINSMAMQDYIFRVVVPVEKEVEIKEGQRRNIERRVFPGYILVEMAELKEGDPESDQAWYVVRNTPGVTGFVSSGDKPVPLREDEVAKILKRMETDEPKVHVTFKTGQTVHIIDGPFADFRGTVDNVDMTKGKVRVLVSFFGRETPVELDLLQVEKV